MSRNLWIVSVAGLGLVLPALASDRDDDIGRIQKATQVFQEIMRTPDKGIPQELLEKAKCVAIVPGEEKLAFIFGGNYGKGLATCRTARGWSAPMFVAVGGGSVGFQIGGSFTDVVMLFMNDHALQSLLSDKFKIGADATVAAGPVGRQAAAGTDIKTQCGDPELFAQQRSFCRGQPGWRRRAGRPQRRQSHVRLQCHPPGNPARQSCGSRARAVPAARNSPSTPHTHEINVKGSVSTAARRLRWRRSVP